MLRRRWIMAFATLAGTLFVMTGTSCPANGGGELAADAGSDVTIQTGQAITLQGSASGGTEPYTFSWVPTTGLSDASAATPTFTATTVGTFEFALTVTDDTGATATDRVTVNVTSGGTGPGTGPLTANAGADVAVAVGATVVLQGTATGGAGGYSFSWAPAASLTNPNTATPSFTPSSLGSTTFTLTVTDADGDTSTDTVTVTASTETRLDSLVWGANFSGGGYLVTAVFSQALDRSSAETEGNYRVTGTSTAPNSAVLESDNRTLSLVFTTPLSATTSIDFSVNNGLLDLNGVALPEFQSTPAANLDDRDRPALVGNGVLWGVNFTGSYQIQVTFNEAMSRDTVEIPSAYRISGTTTNADSASLGNDGRTVTLVFDRIALSTSDEIDISTGNAIRDVNGNTLPQVLNVEVAPNPQDLTAPSVVSASGATGPNNTFRVTVEFDEAMSAEDVEDVNGYRASGSVNDLPTTVELGTDGRTATVTFPNVLGPTDAVRIGIGGRVRDINGRAMTEQVRQVGSTGEDVTGPNAPTLTWEANGTEGYRFTAVFNEAMNSTSVTNVANWRISGTNTNPDSVTYDQDTRTATVTFDALMSRTDKVVVSVGNAILDAEGNPLTQATLPVATNSVDQTPPTVAVGPTWADDFGTNAGQIGYQLTLEFSETMDRTTAASGSNYSMARVDTADMDRVTQNLGQPSSVVLSTDGRTLVLTFATTQAGFRNRDASLQDRLRIDPAVKDVNGRPTTDVIPLRINLNTSEDRTRPLIESVKWSTGNDSRPYQVVIRYNEVMDAATATDAFPYSLSNAALPPGARVTADDATNGIAPIMSPDGKTVTLTFSADANATFQPSDQLFIAADLVKDINGNALAQVQNQVIAQDTSADGDVTAPSLVSAQWVAGPNNNGIVTAYELIIEFSEALNVERFNNLPISIALVGGGTANATLLAGGNRAQVLFTGASYARNTSLSVQSAEDMHGNRTTDSVSTITVVNPADTRSPQVTSANIMFGADFPGPGYQVLVPFDEVLDAVSGGTPSLYRITGLDGLTRSAASASVQADGMTAAAVFQTPLAANPRPPVIVSISDSVRDINGRFAPQTPPIGSFATVTVAQNPNDNSGPNDTALPFVFNNGNSTISVVYDEPLDNASLTGLTFAVTGRTQSGDGVLANDGQTVTVRYEANPGGRTLTLPAIRDINGNAFQVAPTNPTVTIPSAGQVPLVVSAGPDMTVTVGEAIVLQGSATGGSLPYIFAWTPAANLNDASLAMPTFTPAAAGTTNFVLTVTDGVGLVGVDVVTVTAQ